MLLVRATPLAHPSCWARLTVLFPSLLPSIPASLFVPLYRLFFPASSHALFCCCSTTCCILHLASSPSSSSPSYLPVIASHSPHDTRRRHPALHRLSSRAPPPIAIHPPRRAYKTPRTHYAFKFSYDFLSCHDTSSRPSRPPAFRARCGRPASGHADEKRRPSSRPSSSLIRLRQPGSMDPRYVPGALGRRMTPTVPSHSPSRRLTWFLLCPDCVHGCTCTHWIGWIDIRACFSGAANSSRV